MNSSQWTLVLVILAVGLSATGLLVAVNSIPSNPGGVTVNRFSQLDAAAMHEDNERIRAEVATVTAELQRLRETLAARAPRAESSESGETAAAEASSSPPVQNLRGGVQAPGPMERLTPPLPDMERRRHLGEFAEVPEDTIDTAHHMWTTQMVYERYGIPDDVSYGPGGSTWHYSWSNCNMTIHFRDGHALRTDFSKNP